MGPRNSKIQLPEDHCVIRLPPISCFGRRSIIEVSPALQHATLAVDGGALRGASESTVCDAKSTWLQLMVAVITFGGARSRKCPRLLY